MNETKMRINDLMLKRTSDIKKELIEDKGYEELEVRISEVLSRIQEILPNDYDDVLYELSDLYNTRMEMSEFYIYKHGFKDGYKFEKELNLQ